MKTPPVDYITPLKYLLIAILTSVFFGIAAWMIIPAPPVGFYWDDNWYIFIAEWLSPDSSYRELSWNMLWVASYPPLFPLFISWSGASLANQQNAFIMNALFLAVGTGVTMLWFAREGFSAITITIAAILMAFNPVSLAYLSMLYSEFLYILLSTIALALAFSAREWKWNIKWLVIGFIVGLSVATRSVGWMLVAGFLTHLVFHRKLMPAVAFTIGLGTSIMIIPFLLVGLPPSGNYSDQLMRNMSNLNWDFFVHQIQALRGGWTMLWGWGIGAWLAIVAVLPGLFVRLKANRADAWYVIMYLGMLLLWPWPDHMARFLWPLIPCFLVSMHSSLDLLRKPEYRPVFASVLMSLILATSVSDGIGRSLVRLLDPPDGELFQLSRMHEWTRSSTRDEGEVKLKERQQLLKDMKRIDGIVDPKACIYSEISGLVAVQTRQFAIPSQWTSLQEVDSNSLITRIGTNNIYCEYYYMLPHQVAGTGLDDVNRFTAMHEVIFTSFIPNDAKGALPLGVFLRFRPPISK